MVLNRAVTFNMRSYRSECWGRGVVDDDEDDDAMVDVAGCPAHYAAVLQRCRGQGCYLPSWLWRHTGHSLYYRSSTKHR